MTPDFSQIYAELGLHPDCSLEEFQRAYRQCLSERHPDRARGAITQPGAMPLSELTALHSSVIAFHREHGRLPGGVPPAIPPPKLRIGHNYVSTMGAETSRSPIVRRVLATLLIIGLLLLGTFAEHPSDPPSTTAALPESQHPLGWLPPSELRNRPLELGMDTATIRAIQGEPIRINGDTWEYGPSWLRIEHGELVDWYSSPLYRLNTRAPSPGNEPESPTSRHR